MRRGDIEVAITEEGGFSGDTDTSGLEVEHLLDDHMWVSLPADHPLATRHAIELSELRDEDWMLACLTGTCADSNVVLRACQDAGFQPRDRLPVRRLLRDPGPRGQRHGRRADPRPRARQHARRRRGAAGQGPPALPPRRGDHRRATTTGGAIPTMLECLRDAGAVYAESGLAAAA